MGCSAKDGVLMAIIEAIESHYLEADAASVTFSSLGSYEHLQLRISARYNSAGGGSTMIYLRFNSDTAANYTTTLMNAYNGNNINPNRYTNQSEVYGGGRSSGMLDPAADYGASIIDIYDYANTNKNLSLQQLSGVTKGYDDNTYIMTGSALWDNAAAVTSILVYPASASFRRGTQISLYGIKSS